MRPRWQRTTRPEAENIDVTAFLGLMVILVPFLLVTAVFSRMAIIELQPALYESNTDTVSDSLNLEVTLRKTAIEVNYRGQSQPTRIDRTADERPMATLTKLVSELKSLHPQSQAAIVRVEPQVPYLFLVQVLDVLRMRAQSQEGMSNTDSYFPLISLGPADIAAQTGAKTQ
ncbi:MAG: biopolymer transporter ExbD [Halioglobus sp.]